MKRQTDIELLKEPFKTKIKELIQMLEEKGLSFKVFETLRDAKRQQYLLKTGASRIKRSKHQDAIACDFVHFKHGKYDWNDISAYKELGECVHEIGGLVWGGDWKKFKDYVHVELK
ncbi:MAG: M15 family metallopeptidase [Paludibacteraceae bacterium]|nr:M15 family metallopeptidase [Paludibacteraceae bacterium]